MKAFAYLFPTFFKTVLQVYLALAGIVYMVDLSEQSRLLSKHQPGLADLLLYCLGRLPWMAFQLAPIAALLGALLTLYLLGSRQELTALRAAGRGLGTLAAPMMAVALLVSGWIYFGQETATPAGFDYATRIKRQVKGEPLFPRRFNFWYRDGPTHYSIGRFFSGEGLAEGIEAYWLDDEGRLVAWESIQRAQHTGPGSWKFDGIQRRKISAESVRSEWIPTEERGFAGYLEGLAEESYRPERYSRARLERTIEDLEKRGYEVERYSADLAAKNASLPLPFFLMLLALPFGLLPVRAANVTLGAASCSVIAFGLWGLGELGATLGREGILPPFVAAWAAVGIGVFALLPWVAIRLRRMGYW